MSICYLNGEFLPLDQASVSVLDRGFIFGDGVYEVIPAFNGHLFRLQKHLERLQNNLGGVRIEPPLNPAQWCEVLTSLVQRNGGGDQSVYLQITRGVAKRDHVPVGMLTPTVFAMSSPLDKNRIVTPVSAITCEDIRWKFCHIKAITLLPSVLLRFQANDAGAYEAILVKDGLITEGAASNVFIVSNGMIKTPPKGTALLPGVTRDLVVERLFEAGAPCAETDITEPELREAEEIWLTSSTREIVPVVELDGAPVGAGKPGPWWERANRLYQDYKAGVVAPD
jgi:D-alanine transaminase